MPDMRALIRFAFFGSAAHPREAVQHRSGRFQQPNETLKYGRQPLQQLDFYAAGPGPGPLLAFLHGGAWQFGDKARRMKDRKAAFAHEEGWHFASLNFRMVPDVGVREMAGDVASALRCLIDHAELLGIDAGRIVLMGHSSGAHLAALVASDPQYLRRQGLTPNALAGVIANDGAAYDARLPSVASEWLRRRLIAPAFRGDDDAMAAISPATQAREPIDRAPFLILHTAHRLGAAQARALEAGLRAGGTSVERSGFAGCGMMAHVAMSRRFGQRAFPPTEVARLWLRGVFSTRVA